MCKVLAAGRAGEERGGRRDHFSLFNTFSSLKHLCECTSAPSVLGSRGRACWVAAPAPIARQGCPDLMRSEVIPHSYYEQALFSLEIKGLLSKSPIFMKYCFCAAKFDWDLFQKIIIFFITFL